MKKLTKKSRGAKDLKENLGGVELQTVNHDYTFLFPKFCFLWDNFSRIGGKKKSHHPPLLVTRSSETKKKNLISAFAFWNCSGFDEKLILLHQKRCSVPFLKLSVLCFCNSAWFCWFYFYQDQECLLICTSLYTVYIHIYSICMHRFVKFGCEACFSFQCCH